MTNATKARANRRENGGEPKPAIEKPQTFDLRGLHIEELNMIHAFCSRGQFPSIGEKQIAISLQTRIEQLVSE